VKRVRWFSVALVLAVALSGCVTVDMAAPSCGDDGRNTLVLLAQSVPTASHVPCIDVMPSGWTMHMMEVKSGASSFSFTNASFAGRFLVDVDFAGSCEPGEASQVPSDEEGVDRFETVSTVGDGYDGLRYYVFDGGCVTYRFDVHGDGWSAAVNDASLAMTFETRETLEEYVRTSSRGVIDEL
jgi:hypothetical protein